MDYERELKRLENIALLRDMVDKIKTGMLTTFNLENGFHSRPMGTAQVDVDGNIWFFTNEFSPKVAEISHENKVSVTYTDVNNHTYISVVGTAHIVDDRAKMQELWNPFVKAFFPEGLDDPKLTLLKIETTGAEYWDSSASKMVILFNVLKAAITGKKYDEGKHDTIEL